MSATVIWRDLLRDICEFGDVVSHAARAHEPRSQQSMELVGHQTRWSMAYPVVACPLRQVGRRFMAAEAAWIITGDNRLSTIAPYARHMRQFSADGSHLSGAYGPPFVDQLPYVVQSLARDANSRQAVATLWRPRPAPDPDIPCTVALQWLIRAGQLRCVATMRSSDAWLGVPYDVHSFSVMSTLVAIELRSHGLDLSLGELVLTCGSQHLYERDWKNAGDCAQQTDEPDCDVVLDPRRYASRGHLESDLWARAQKVEEAAE